MVQLKLMRTDKIILLVIIKFLSGITFATSGKVRGMTNPDFVPSNESNFQREDEKVHRLRRRNLIARIQQVKVKRARKKIENADVVIIGAGWAGLSAAKTLSKKDPALDIVILEANDYIGGRSHSVDVGDKNEMVSVDLGSEWIESHTWTYYDSDGISSVGDCTEEVMNELAMSLKNQCPSREELTFAEDDIAANDDYTEWWDIFAEGKGLLTKKERNDLENVWNGTEGFLNYEAKERKRAVKTGKDESVESALEEYESKKDLNEKQKNYLKMQTNTNIGTTYAADLKKLSLIESESKALYMTKYFGEYGGHSTYPANTYMGGNYGTFADRFAKCESMSGNVADHVRLRSQVKRIQYNRGKDKRAKIGYLKTDARGNKEWKRIRAKVVLSTVSLGVLKANLIKFVPSLTTKQEAITGMNFGTLDKWVGFWKKDTTVPWDDRITTAHVMSLVSAESSNGNDNFDLFYNPYPLNGEHKIITGFIAGSAAREMEKKNDEEINASAMSSMRKMYPTVPEPFEYKVTRWHKDPFFKGSYASPKVGRNHNNDAEILRRPIGCLFFAGEATSVGWYGSVTGAYTSGNDAAVSILSFLET